MKRNIQIKEKELVDRLNAALKKRPYEAPCMNYIASVDPAEGHDWTAVSITENKDTQMRTPKDELRAPYEEVNHPQHYNNYDVEVIDMMEKIFGKEETAIFCKLNAFKYRMRAGTKPGQSADKDLKKEQWYLDRKRELEQN